MGIPAINIVNIRPQTITSNTSLINESKMIRDLSTEIKNIQSQTEYIKREGKLPPTTPDYYKQLKII